MSSPNDQQNVSILAELHVTMLRALLGLSSPNNTTTPTGNASQASTRAQPNRNRRRGQIMAQDNWRASARPVTQGPDQTESTVVPPPAISSIRDPIPEVTSIQPSAMLQPQRRNRNTSDRIIETVYRQEHGFRPGYNGDITNPANHPNQVGADENCNFWIKELPGNCTERDLERAIRDIGTIWSMAISPPDLTKGHKYAAASVAFTRRNSAEEFLSRAEEFGFYVRGQLAQVGWNRNRIGPQHDENPLCRVLTIAGAGDVVNKEKLGEFFARYCHYRTTGIVDLAKYDDGNTVMEWRFARASGQSSIAADCVQALHDEHGFNIQSWFGIDPCEEIDILLGHHRSYRLIKSSITPAWM